MMIIGRGQKRFLYLLLTLIVCFGGCSPVSKTTITSGSMHPMQKEQLVLAPFTFAPTVRNFRKNLGRSFKLQVYTVKNQYVHNQIDTIFRFHHRKTELFVYKAYHRELFIAGNIYNDRITLRNGVRVGISRPDFEKCFTDLLSDHKDTVWLTSKKALNSFYFIFRHDRLTAIRINNYFE